MKKLIAMALVLVMVCGMLPTVALAEEVLSGTCGDNLTWTQNAEGVLTISGTGPMWDFDESVPGWNLAGGQMTHVVIEPGVTSIGAHAFEMCGLTSIDIPDTVTSIGEYAFHLSCLESVVIPDSVTQFGETIFGESMLGEVKLPANMTEIPNNMFHGCSEMTSVEIPASVSSIGDYAFFNTSIERVTVPAGVVSLGTMAFGNYWKFEYAEVTFQGDAPTIADGAFAYQNVTVFYPEGNDTWDDVISSYVPDEGDSITWVPYGDETTEEPGDMDGDGNVDETDVIQLLWYILFPDDYEIIGDADFNHDGNVDEDDVIYLLWYTLFPEDYPLN